MQRVVIDCSGRCGGVGWNARVTYICPHGPLFQTRFCPPCITTWAATDTHCPACRVRFRTITHKRLRAAGSGGGGDGGLSVAGKLPGEVVSVKRVEEFT